MKKGTTSHENMLKLELYCHELQGKRVINLGGKSPDGIVIDWEQRKVIAVDVISGDTKPLGHRMNYHQKQKKDLYSNLGFDEVLVPLFYKEGSENLKKIHYKETLNKF